MLNVITQITKERNRQDQKHPYFPAEIRMAVLAEEVGEVAKALNDEETKEALKAELVQVAAVAIRWIEALDQEKLKDE